MGMTSPTHNGNSMDGFNTLTFRTSSIATPQPGGMPQQIQQQSSMQQQPQQLMVSSNGAASQGGAPMTSAPQPLGVALDPLFVAPPPKTHKALHSDVSFAIRQRGAMWNTHLLKKMGAPRGPQQFFHDYDFEARTKCQHLVNKTFFFYSPFRRSDIKTC